MFSWIWGRGASRRAVAKVAAAIDETLWQQHIAALPFLRGLTSQELATLRQHCAWFLASKSFHGAHGLQVDDGMALTIALQACLPILHLGTAWYEGWSGIVVYPEVFITHERMQDEAGLVHQSDEPTLGLAIDGGPVLLSWPQSQPGQGAMNVVIHEFAHKLDMAHGEADGMPHLGGSGIAPGRWRATLEQAWRRLARAIELLESAMPDEAIAEAEAPTPASHAPSWPGYPPYPPQVQALYDGLPLDPYAASDEAEFFAVSSETFFVDPLRLRQWQPQWYALLAAFYRQDPAARLGGSSE
ncbi:MAG: zinc-dependent peptidase [Comamonadaceae bacterium]|nr:zinc-dependent peptidase [Comamonadaceae bacterium]